MEIMQSNRIKKLTPLVETEFLNLYKADHVIKDGSVKNWIIASRKSIDDLKKNYFEGEEDKIDAVVMVAFHTEEKKLVLIREFRVPINDYVYELPAGLVEKDERIEETIYRELKEETGLDITSIDYEKSNMKAYLSPGMTDESVALVYCRCEGIITDEFLEDDEDIKAILVSQEEAKELLKKNEKMDAKMFMVLQSFAILGEQLF
jgi:ADP-ribose pyrophosphatase